jgi:hypothetical protein
MAIMRLEGFGKLEKFSDQGTMLEARKSGGLKPVEANKCFQFT